MTFQDNEIQELKQLQKDIASGNPYLNFTIEILSKYSEELLNDPSNPITILNS